MAVTDETIACYDATAEVFAARTMALRLHGLEPFRAALPTGALVLDLGCGPGRDCRWLHELGLRTVGLDLSAGLLELARRHHPEGAWARGDMRRLPFRDAAFDGLWFCASLLHIPSAQAPGVLAEARRVCRQGAPLHLAVQRGDGERWFPHESGTGRRFFCFWQADELRVAIETAGFAVGAIDTSPDSRPGLEWLNVRATAA